MGNGQQIYDFYNISIILGRQLEFINGEKNIDSHFRIKKVNLENILLNCTTNEEPLYNNLFTMEEYEAAMNFNNNSAPVICQRYYLI